MDELSRRIAAYLVNLTSDGEEYVRSKDIAEAIGSTPKKVGHRMNRLAENVDSIGVEPWAKSRATTWRVYPKE